MGTEGRAYLYNCIAFKLTADNNGMTEVTDFNEELLLHRTYRMSWARAIYGGIRICPGGICLGICLGVYAWRAGGGGVGYQLYGVTVATWPVYRRHVAWCRTRIFVAYRLSATHRENTYGQEALMETLTPPCCSTITRPTLTRRYTNTHTHVENNKTSVWRVAGRLHAKPHHATLLCASPQKIHDSTWALHMKTNNCRSNTIKISGRLNIHVCEHACVHVCLRACVHVCACVYMCACVCMCVRANV